MPYRLTVTGKCSEFYFFWIFQFPKVLIWHGQKLHSTLQCHSNSCYSAAVTKVKSNTNTATDCRMLPGSIYLCSFSYHLPRSLNVGKRFKILLYVLTDIPNNLANSFCCPSAKSLQQSPMGLMTASGNAKELKIPEYIKAGYERNSKLFSTYPKVLHLLDFVFHIVFSEHFT